MQEVHGKVQIVVMNEIAGGGCARPAILNTLPRESIKKVTLVCVAFMSTKALVAFCQLCT